MKSLAPELPQKTYWELTATPQTVFAADVALGMKVVVGGAPAERRPADRAWLPAPK